MSDVISVLTWWVVLGVIGLIFIPFTSLIFDKFLDKGYIFSKILGTCVIGYAVFLLAILHILPFSLPTIYLVLAIGIISQIILYIKKPQKITSLTIRYWIIEEFIFLIALFAWSFIRAHQPDIIGLEKFMDYGFLNSILRAKYFPPKDMWFPPFPINYYYFGHYLTALLTKLSFLPSNITFNLMIATLFALMFTESFSIGINLIQSLITSDFRRIWAGFLSAILVTLAGNLHTIYTLFSPYPSDNPLPPWQLHFQPLSFPNNYWYPNATRFIPYTIHEFPIYSFVVSDLHGHVLDIPLVLFTIALMYQVILKRKYAYRYLALTAFFISLMYMTNAWDGAIYLLLASLILVIVNLVITKKPIKKWSDRVYFFVDSLIKSIIASLPKILLLAGGFFLFSFPFNLYFKPFVSGIGVVCAPNFLFKSTVTPAGISYAVNKIGPFLFEPNHCTRSPLWMLLILYGFFYFFIIVFAIAFVQLKQKMKKPAHLFALALILLATVLIIIPEFVYVKDIYPQYYRANTMFKLVYQAFIMLSLVSGFVIAAIVKPTRNIFLYIITIILLGFVLIYPYFAINSYYGNLKTYYGIDGTAYLKTRYPDDYLAIQWMNTHIKGQPTIVEAQGDSYTDYERISANTGLPTVLGWTVHEWLWRGSYDIPAPRITDVQKIYESTSIPETKQLLHKYNVKYVYVGNMERQKYPEIQQQKFGLIGHIIYHNNSVTIYRI